MNASLKLISLMLPLSSAFLQVQADNKFFRIHGSLQDAPDTIVVELYGRAGVRERKLIASKEQPFDIEFQMSDACNLTVYGQGEMAEKHFYTIAVPGEQLVISGGFTDNRVSGSPFYNRYFTLEKSIKKGEINPYDYIVAHPDDDVSGLLIGYVADKQKTYEAFDILSDKVKEGRTGAYAASVVSFHKQIDRINAGGEKHKVGTESTDFELPDLQGNPFSLSSLRGKYVMLDFWGSWCGSCIAEFPELKSIYEKCKGKLEILGIDCDDTEARWKAAVEKYQLPWLHVRQSKETRNIREEYGVEGYPTLILIDPKGVIVKKTMGDRSSFFSYIDSLFSD